MSIYGGTIIPENDELGHKIEELAKATEKYFNSYKQLCKAKADYEKAQLDIRTNEMLCLRAKQEYDTVMSRFY